jgi:hypothetical protein
MSVSFAPVAGLAINLSLTSDATILAAVAKRYGVAEDKIEISCRRGSLRLVTLKDGQFTSTGFRSVAVDDKGNSLAEFPQFPIVFTGDAIKQDGDKITISLGGKTLHEWKAEQVTIHHAIQGVQIAVFRHGGQTYAITPSNLDPKNSDFASRSPKFLTLLKEAGVDIDALYGKEKENPNVYIFLVSHDGLLMVDQVSIPKPFALLISQYMSYRKDDGRFAAKDVSEDLYLPTDMLTSLPSYFTKPFVGYQKPLTVAQAQHHLTYGWNKEFKAPCPELGKGEALIIRVEGEGDYKMYSPAHAYRQKLAGTFPARPYGLTKLKGDKSLTLVPYFIDPNTQEMTECKDVDANRDTLLFQHYLYAVNNADKDKVKALASVTIDVAQVKDKLARIFSEFYLLNQRQGSPLHNKHVYKFLSSACNVIKASGPLPRESDKQYALMSKYLSSVTFTEEELHRLNKGVLFIEAKKKTLMQKQ